MHNVWREVNTRILEHSLGKIVQYSYIYSVNLTDDVSPLMFCPVRDHNINDRHAGSTTGVRKPTVRRPLVRSPKSTKAQRPQTFEDQWCDARMLLEQGKLAPNTATRQRMSEPTVTLVNERWSTYSDLCTFQTVLCQSTERASSSQL